MSAPSPSLPPAPAATSRTTSARKRMPSAIARELEADAQAAAAAAAAAAQTPTTPRGGDGSTTKKRKQQHSHSTDDTTPTSGSGRPRKSANTGAAAASSSSSSKSKPAQSPRSLQDDTRDGLSQSEWAARHFMEAVRFDSRGRQQIQPSHHQAEDPEEEEQGGEGSIYEDERGFRYDAAGRRILYDENGEEIGIGGDDGTYEDEEGVVWQMEDQQPYQEQYVPAGQDPESSDEESEDLLAHLPSVDSSLRGRSIPPSASILVLFQRTSLQRTEYWTFPYGHLTNTIACTLCTLNGWGINPNDMLSQLDILWGSKEEEHIGWKEVEVQQQQAPFAMQPSQPHPHLLLYQQQHRQMLALQQSLQTKSNPSPQQIQVLHQLQQQQAFLWAQITQMQQMTQHQHMMQQQNQHLFPFYKPQPESISYAVALDYSPATVVQQRQLPQATQSIVPLVEPKHETNGSTATTTNGDVEMKEQAAPPTEPAKTEPQTQPSIQAHTNGNTPAAASTTSPTVTAATVPATALSTPPVIAQAVVPATAATAAVTAATSPFLAAPIVVPPAAAAAASAATASVVPASTLATAVVPSAYHQPLAQQASFHPHSFLYQPPQPTTQRVYFGKHPDWKRIGVQSFDKTQPGKAYEPIQIGGHVAMSFQITFL